MDRWSAALMFAKWSVLLVLLSGMNLSSAFGQSSDLPPVLPPPGSGLNALQFDSSTFDPPQPSFSDHDTSFELLEDSFAEAIDTGPIVSIEPHGWYEPTYWFGPAPWDIGIQFGLNGSEGVNETMSLQSGGHLKRESKHWNLDTSLAYNKNTNNDIETQNNALLDVRIDRILKESPWSLYILHQTLYDEFQAYDLRVSANTGVGYQLFDTKTIDLIGRFGGGASREFGGPDNQWAAEALMGLEYEHSISDMQRFSAKVDYYPEWEQFDNYRIVADAGWEIDLDRPKNLSLKFSVVDRYDSTPNGVQPNELNYAALLIWGL